MFSSHLVNDIYMSSTSVTKLEGAPPTRYVEAPPSGLNRELTDQSNVLRGPPLELRGPAPRGCGGLCYATDFFLSVLWKMIPFYR